jgi:predicted ATP-dependent protease
MMNDDINNAGDGNESLAQKIVTALRKSGCEAWLGFPPPEEMERLRAEKAERDFQQSKRRAEAQDRRREALIQRAKQIFRGENADE